MPNRAGDWWAQATRDLEHGRETRHAGRHEWSCFACHQAAEKAVKALHLSRGQEAWGHVVAKLLVELPDDIVVPDDLVDAARVLDNFYIPTRDPNSHPDGPTFSHYGPRQSQEAIACAGAILAFVRSAMA